MNFTDPKSNGSAFPTPLISAAELIAVCTAGCEPVIIDCSFDLADTDAGARAFAAAHLPNAVYAHLDKDLSGVKTGSNGRHPLPARVDWAASLGRFGVTPERPVVVYDTQGGMYAARAWWMLLWVGHRVVSVLDGGLAAWRVAGGTTETGTASAHTGTGSVYPVAESLVRIVEAEQLLESLGRLTVLDARAGERFRGEVEPMDARAGHIPGARSRFFKDNLEANGCFRAPQTLRASFESFQVSPSQIVHQCGSGVTACHNLLAMEIAGLSGSALYPGSWSEWSANPARPIEVG